MVWCPRLITFKGLLYQRWFIIVSWGCTCASLICVIDGTKTLWSWQEKNEVVRQRKQQTLLQGDFFQVGESIKASNFNHDILRWTKVGLWLQTTWHLFFKKEKIFLTNFVSIFIKIKISGKSMFFLFLLIWINLKLQNQSKKLFWIKSKVKISKSVIKINRYSTFWPKKIIFVHYSKIHYCEKMIWT